MRNRLKVIRYESRKDKVNKKKNVYRYKDEEEKKQTSLNQHTEPHRILSWWSAGGE